MRSTRIPLPLLIFLQMLPATLVVPAIRPLFADYHGGGQAAMHAFMSVNMVGAAALVPWIGAWIDGGRSPRTILVGLAAADAVLLLLLATPLPTALILGLRTLEGAAHVGAATVLIARAATRSTRGASRGRAMGGAGAGLVAAIVSGSAIGAALVAIDVRAPLLAAAALEGVVALVAAWTPATDAEPAERRPRLGVAAAVALVRAHRALWLPVGAAFVARFTIGCIVVSFALFAHQQHGLGDATIGLLFASLTLPFAVATYPAARLCDRLSATSLLRVGMAVYAASLVGLGYAPTAALPALMLVAGTASGAIFAAVLWQTSAAAPESGHGRAMALVNAAGCAGMVLGPMVAGVTIATLSAKLGQVAAYRAVFALAASSGLVWLVASQRRRAPRLASTARPTAARESA